MTWSLYFQWLGKYPTWNIEMFKCVCIKYMVSEFKGKVQTILIAQKLSHSCFIDSRHKTLITFDLFRGLVILFMRKLKVRLTLYFSDSDLAGMMYLSHSSSWILQKKNLLSQLIKLIRGSKKTRSHTYICVCIDKYTDVFYTYIFVYIYYTYI